MESINIQKVKISSIIDNKKHTVYIIKESIIEKNKIFNIIENLILKDIKNNLNIKDEINHYDGN